MILYERVIEATRIATLEMKTLNVKDLQGDEEEQEAGTLLAGKK